MGCDIHLHIEIKIDNEWLHYSTPRIKRNYRLFSKMAGVRSYDGEEAISLPKGLPPNLTKITQLDADYWMDDGHSHSFLDENEIDKLEDYCSLQGGQSKAWDLEWDILQCYLFNNSFTGWKKYPKENKFKIQAVRFVFWFDN